MKILIFGYGGDSTSAVSYILENLFELVKKQDDLDVTFFGCSNNNKNENGDVKKVFIKNPFTSNRLNFYRVIRKTRTIFRLDQLCLSWKYIYKKANSVFKDETFDYVIGASGPFMYMNAAYHFAKQRKAKFGCMYFDSFTNSFSAINRSKRRELETEWYDYASFVLIDSDDASLPFEDRKHIVKPFLIPIFEKESVNKNDGSLVYGGTFYDNFRPQSVLDGFLKRLSPADSVCIYSKNYKHTLNDVNCDLHVMPMVNPSDFDNICKECKAIIVMGNGNNQNASPSKVLHALSFHKPIIGLNFKEIPEILKEYPLFVSGDDVDVINKINQMYDKGIPQFKLYSLYKERSPEVVLNLFKEALK